MQEEQRLESERARIITEEEIGVAEENKARQVLVAQRNKEKTDAVELERVSRDRDLEKTERLRVVGVADVDGAVAVGVCPCPQSPGVACHGVPRRVMGELCREAAEDALAAPAGAAADQAP